MKKKYIIPDSLVFEISTATLMAHHSIDSISPSKSIDTDYTTVINGKIIGEDVTSGTISGDSKSDTWTFE